ncbi:MAG: caspase family protein [Sandaracinaceae bacterium]|nr:caspase family protein [Sandaracinaceae bacterium]
MSSPRARTFLATAMLSSLTAPVVASCGAAPVADESTMVAVDRPPPDAPVTGPRPLALGPTGAEVSAMLGPGPTDPGERDDSGRFVHRYALSLAEGTRLRFHVPSYDGFDPMIRLEGPNGFQITNDDAFPHTLDALLELSPPVSGEYVLTVTTAPIGQTGQYVLRISPNAGTGEAVTLGQRVQSSLGASADPAFPGRSFHTFEAQGGAVIRVRVTSRDFDTIATVIGPNGQLWVNDDANDLGADGSERALDSTVEMSAPVTGTYQVVVSSYAPQGRGAFALTTSMRPPVTYVAGETVPRGGFAGTQGQGRILGLYGGITAYQSNAQLYGCADDATLLGEAMRAAHLQRVDEQIVLTDAQVTRAQFLEGVRTLARRAQPNDVVLVFFSGHGNVQPVAQGDASELDGLDETIILFDGPVTDNDLASELSQIHAENVILALDTCHSGGFADDWVRAPGRVGLFSSDGDVLSDTAEPRRAGGYLSWYLRRGVLGEADYKPHDGVLHAGEFTDYLLEGMVRDHRLMNPDGSVDPSQRFVLARGGVVWDDVLWVYPRGEDLALPEVPPNTLESPAP